MLFRSLDTPGKTLTKKEVMASSDPTPVRSSAASLTTKSCSSKASSKMSSLTFGHSLDSFSKASRRVYEVGVAGQSVMGALDHAVRMVSGEVSSSLVSAWVGASAIMVSLFAISGGGAIGVRAVGVRATGGRSCDCRGGPYVPEASRVIRSS